MQVFAASAHIPTCVMLIGGVGWMAGPVRSRGKASAYGFAGAAIGRRRWNEAAVDLNQARQ